MKTLCESCKNYDISVEIRNNKVTEYPSCMYFHQWFKRVSEPKQCRDFEAEDDRD